MSNLNLRLDLHKELFNHRTAEPLAANLPSFQTARNGEVVAIYLIYSNAYPGPFRSDPASFVIKTATGIAFLDYAKLPAASRAGLADSVMRLEDDYVYSDHVHNRISTTENFEDDEYHHVFIMADAIGIVRPDVADIWFQSDWCEKRLSSFQRLLLLEAQSAHDAMTRHDDLDGLVRLWRFVLDHFNRTKNFPCLTAPTVGDLLVNSC